MKRSNKHIAELPHRLETRWLIPTCTYEEVRKEIASFLQPIRYSNKLWVRTIYLNNDSHDVPWDLNIKVRNYYTEPLKGPFQAMKGTWMLETKITQQGEIIRKQKSRRSLPLPDILQQYKNLNAFCHIKNSGFVACPLNDPLRPFLALEYHREHFIYQQPEGYLRVTLDRNIRFWHQLDEGIWIPLGSENGVRIEVKCDPHLIASLIFRRFTKALVRFTAVPIISKRYAALNRLTSWQRSLVPLPFYETPHKEYAASFSISPSRAPSLSAELFQLFKHPYQGYHLDPKRHWMSEGSMVCLYLTGNRRINLYGDSCRKVRDRRFVPQSFRHDSTQRQEIKGGEYIIVPTLLAQYMKSHKPYGALMRYKRQFWVRSKTGRTYKISVNRFFHCATQRYLTGLDIRYAGSATDRVSGGARAIAKEMKILISALRKKFIDLHPTRHLLHTFTIDQTENEIYPILKVMNSWMDGRDKHYRHK